MTSTLAEPDADVSPAGGRDVTSDLIASRARIAASADENRRRLQRDLHGEVEQRLVHAVVALRLAREALAAGQRPEELIDEALAHAERARSGLSAVLRDALPTILVHSGLRAGLESVCADLGPAAQVRVAAPRMAVATETTAYLVVAEALGVVARGVERVQVDVELRSDVLVIEVRGDHSHERHASPGPELGGVMDRVNAAGGTVAITSAAGTGTHLRATLPVERA